MVNVSERARKLHYSSIVIDTHTDSIDRETDTHEDLGQRLGSGFSDLPRLKEGNLTSQFFACFVNPKYIPRGQSIKRVLDMADAVKRLCERYPKEIGLAKTASEVRDLAKQGKRSAILAIEGGHAIEDDLAVLRIYHELGVRYMTLTWNNTNNWADGVLDKSKHNGITDFGREVVREMERLGMMVDVSHASEKTFWDVMAEAKKPVIASHSSAWALCQHPRNLKDEQIKAMKKNGGVVCVCFVSQFLWEPYRQEFEDLMHRTKLEIWELRQKHQDLQALEVEMKKLQSRFDAATAEFESRPRLQHIADQIDHVANLAGIDHVGLGIDLNFHCIPQDVNDCTKLPLLTEELLRRGYTEQEVRKVLGENVLRLMEETVGR
jgi:membrane dipeptidase